MRFTIVFLVVLAWSSIGQARTWRVNVLGTGDAPTLYAAMDSAAALDTVLVEAGTYALASSLSVPYGVRLVGESGPSQTLLYRDDFGPGAVSLSNASIRGIHVRANTQAVLFLHNAGAYDCIIEGNIEGLGYPAVFQNCLLLGGEVAFPSSFVSCIIMSYLGMYAVGSTLINNDVLGAVYPGIDSSSANLNFSLDPQFCGLPDSGNYFLRSTSPCLPENNPYGPVGGVLIGPLGLGCGAVGVQTRTWGSIKAMYR